VKSTLLFRVEDLLVTGWVAIASPILFKVGGDKGPFETGQPLDGLLRIAAVLGVVACLAARRKVDQGSPPQLSLLNRASVGPFVGGLLLVTISGFTALGAPTAAVYAVLLVAAIGIIAIRVALPPVSVLVRRALVSPFVMIAGGLYWTVIEQVVSPGAASLRRSAPLDLRSVELPLFVLIAFSAIYYAAGIALGIGWLSILSS
jgi:dipeptide/tripeptide permease